MAEELVIPKTFVDLVKLDRQTLDSISENWNELKTAFDESTQKLVEQVQQGKDSLKERQETNKKLQQILTSGGKDSAYYREIQEKLESLGKIVPPYLKKQVEKQAEITRINEEYNKRSEMIADLQKRGELSPTQRRYMEMRNKLTKHYDKWLIKNKFFQKVNDSLKSMVAGAGNWLFKILTLLFALALFDPKGKFLKSILTFITKMATWLIRTIIDMLPQVLSTMWSLFWDVLVPGIADMGKAIGEALFGKDTVLAKIFGVLGGILPIVVVGIGLFTKLSAVLSALGITIGATVGLIIAIGVALVALWVYADKIALWFEDLFKWFSNLGIVMKLLLLPVFAVIGIFYGLVKLFQAIKKYGFVKTMEMIWESIKQFFANIWESTKQFFINIVNTIWNSFFMKIWEGILWIAKPWITFYKFIFKKLLPIFKIFLKFFLNIWKAFKAFFTGQISFGDFTGKILNAFSSMFSSMFDLFGKMKIKIANVFEDIWNTIKGIFTGMVDWIYDTLPSWMLPEEETPKPTQVKKVIEKGAETGRIEETVMRATGKEKLTAKEMELTRKAQAGDSDALREIASLMRKQTATTERSRGRVTNFIKNNTTSASKQQSG